MTNSIQDVEQARFILAVGTNTTETHPVISLRVRKAVNQGATLVVVDPRRTEMAAMAHRHLQIAPGSDLALFLAMAHVIVRDGLTDDEFIQERTEGFDDLAQSLKPYTPEWAEPLTAIPSSVIEQVARDYAQTSPASILYTMGLTQHVTGTDNVLSIANLALLTGNLGKPGAGVNPLRGQNNVQGACDMGALPNVLPGYQPVTDDGARERVGRIWDLEGLAAEPGMMMGQMFDEAAAGKVKAMYIVGENPALSDPDATHVVEALEKLDCLVVQDIFLTETAQLADVVLPGASFAEKEGTFTNTERRIQRVRRAVEPVGASLPDGEIVCRLAREMGGDLGSSDPARVMEEIASVVPQYGGVSHERLDREGSLQWPCPDGDHGGTAIMYEETFPRGRARFHALEYRPAADESCPPEYNLQLGTGRRLYQYHTGSMSRRTPLAKLYPEEFLDVSREDARSLGLQDGDQVRVSSPRGSVEMRARISDEVAPGTVFASFHFAEAAINTLTDPRRDPVSGIPQLKVCGVKVEKVG